MMKSNEPTKMKKAMKKTMKFLSMAALALVGAVMTGCSSDDNIDTPQQPTNNVVTVKTTVSLGGNDTRALNPSTGAKTFAVGDQIAVVYTQEGGTTAKATSVALAAGDITNGNQTATFTVTLTNPQAGTVDYVYPAAMANDDGTMASIANQEGTLATLQSTYDYAKGSGSMTVSGSDITLPTDVTMTNQLAICALTLKNADGSSDITSTITGMTISDGTNTYTISRSAAAGPIYVAMQPVTAALEFTASDGTNNYVKTATSRTYTAGNLYNLGLRMTEVDPMLSVPLTLEAKTAGTIVISSPKSGMQYTKNGGAKTAVPGSITVAAGDIVQFYGNGTSITKYLGTYITGGTADCYIYGNIMSLVDEVNFATATELTETYAFASFFQKNNHLVNHDTKRLVLPATTLSSYCYQSIFFRCTGLTTAPELPATTLASYCYDGMFCDCTNLTIAPELPATQLAYGCYDSMFSGCTNLTTAPERLPAMTLTERCYYEMFYQCTNLTTAPELPATTLAKSCYSSMFQGCTNLTTVPERLPATTLADYCYWYMFYECRNLTAAPELPATTLATSCYNSMFLRCTSLSIAPSLPATTLAENCYNYMFSYCTSMTTVPERLPATTLANYCYAYMFQGCTSLTTAPELPATTLADYCYKGMFYNCSSLKAVTCLATTFGTQSTQGWIHGVSTSGTFTKAAGVNWEAGSSGILSGWTVVER